MYSVQCTVQARVLGVAHPNGGTQLTGPGGQHSVCQKQKITSAIYKYNTGCWSEAEYFTRVMSCWCDNEIIPVWTARALVLHNWLPWPLLLAAAAGFVIAAPRMGPCPHLRYILHILKLNFIQLLQSDLSTLTWSSWWPGLLRLTWGLGGGKVASWCQPKFLISFFREKSPVMDS